MEKKYISQKNPTAVIDLGSNSVRLMLTGQEYSKQSIIIRLGEGLSYTGVLSIDAMRRAVDAVSYFAGLAKDAGAKDIRIFATQAVRAAKNAGELKKMIFEACGLEVEVLDGKTEALCGFLGAAFNIPQNLTAAVIDIGGASTEITIGKPPKEISCSKSVPIGAVVLRDLYLQDQGRFEALIKESLDAFKEVKAQSFIGIGGTFCSLSAMIMNLKEYDSKKVDNSVISLNALEDLHKNIWEKDEQEILEKYSFLGQRARVIKFGAFWALSLMRRFDMPKIYVSEKDNLEGYCVLKNIKL
ncbi:MAG TPA: hypothetical protein VIL23_01920 [Clostridia bacterium]